MVTVQEARQQVTQARQSIQQQQQQIQEARTEVQQTELRALTRAELQVRGREDILTRKLQSRQLEGLKKEQLTKLDPFETEIKQRRFEIDKFDTQVRAIERLVKDQREFEQAVKVAQGIVDKGISSTFAPRKIRELVRRIKNREKVFKIRTEQIKVLREFGLIIGTTKLLKLTVDVLKNLSLKKLEVLEKTRLITSKIKEKAEKIIQKVKKESEQLKIQRRAPLTKEQIRKLNIRDPVASLVVVGIPLFAQTLFKDFVNDPRDREAIRSNLRKFQKEGDKIIDKLDTARIKVEELLDPSQKELRERAEESFDFIENQQKILNRDIEKFNKKFGDEELTDKEFENATALAISFEARQQGINQRTAGAISKLDALKEASELQVETFFKSTLKGIVTSPITLAQLGIAASTRPIKTTKDFFKAIKELPQTFSVTPFSTAGTLLGTAVGTKLTADILFASPQLFKGDRVPVTRNELTNALKKGGKTFDNILKELKRFAKDKRAQAQIAAIVRKKKKKKKKDGGLQELTDILEDLDDIGDFVTKNKIIESSVKKMLTKIKEAKTLEKKIEMTLALRKVMSVWKKKGIIKIQPPIFQIVSKPKRPIGSKRTAAELRIIPQRQLQTGRQKRLVSRFRKQRDELILFKQDSVKQLKKQRQKLLSTQSTAISLISLNRQSPTQKNKQLLATAFSQISSQTSILKSSQTEALKQSTALANALFSTQANLLSSKTAQVSIGRLRKRVLIKEKVITKPKIIPILKLKEIIETKLIKAVKKIGKEGVDVLVGMQLKKRKTIGKNLPKWKALRKAQRFVDSNIEASYLLKKSGKKAKGKDIKSFIPSFKFRSSKTNPLFQIELLKHRLDHPREVAQLKAARKAKVKFPSGFFPRLKKRKKKK